MNYQIAEDLLDALERVVAISDRKHDAWDAAKAAIAKARIALKEAAMKLATLPIKQYAVCSEDEDVLTADDDTDFEQAENLLAKMRIEEPDKSWDLVAVVAA